jgi:hypothetical protein
MNFVIAGFATSRGGIAFDPSLPVTDPQLAVSTPIVAYARTLDIDGLSGKFDAIVPMGHLSGNAVVQGSRVEREVDGFADPLLRLSVNLYGAPALTAAEFRQYAQDLVVGASLQVSVPVGQYDPTKVVNLGSNRWSFKPEFGVSQALGRWTLEAQAAVTWFTANDEFFNGSRRAQDPLFSVQGHVIYNFASGSWASIDATHFTGGRSTVDGEHGNDLQRNWRLGATLALPVDLQNSFKLYASRGVSARTGNSFDLVGAAWQYRWGGGL